MLGSQVDGPWSLVWATVVLGDKVTRLLTFLGSGDIWTLEAGIKLMWDLCSCLPCWWPNK